MGRGDYLNLEVALGSPPGDNRIRERFAAGVRYFLKFFSKGT